MKEKKRKKGSSDCIVISSGTDDRHNIRATVPDVQSPTLSVSFSKLKHDKRIKLSPKPVDDMPPKDKERKKKKKTKKDHEERVNDEAGEPSTSHISSENKWATKRRVVSSSDNE